jgi:alpha-D-ribose 1-methylphosphonate 5-triphosphate diphosphatase
MKDELIITGGLIVTLREVFWGSLQVVDGVIQELAVGRTRASGVIDLEGDFLLPGFIDVHTDNLEKHMAPRPEVLWPSPLVALLAHDTQVCGAGITTVLDCVFLGAYKSNSLRPRILHDSIAAIRRARELDLTRAEHLLHLRCEVPDPALMDYFEPYVHEPHLKLVSLNDHTPGQRQWHDLDRYLAYHRASNISAEELAIRIAELTKLQDRNAITNRAKVLEMCRSLNVPLASHDDTTEAHVLQAAADGIRISEFPTTMEAAKKAHDLGLKVVAGAPNLVRGGSHSANVSARDLAAAGVLDVLSSDYFPAGLVQAAFHLHHHLDFPLPQAVARISANPARAVRLEDRGQISPGFRADLVRVRICDDLPVVCTVWRQGRRVS